MKDFQIEEHFVSRVPSADWISEIRKELFGDLLGKIEILEKELERQSRRIDMRAEQSTEAWFQLEKRIISLASDFENLEKRVKRIEDEFST